MKRWALVEVDESNDGSVYPCQPDPIAESRAAALIAVAEWASRATDHYAHPQLRNALDNLRAVWPDFGKE